MAMLAGCGSTRFLVYPPQVRGNRIDPDRLAELVPGTSTKGDVTALLGSPTMKATFDENTWLYVSEVTRPQIAATQHVIDQQVVAVSFDAKGTLKAVDTKTEADARSSSMVSQTTPSPGTEASFFQQLFGNIGRYSPLLGGNGASASGGSGTSGNY
jgi:outer membrane protein assembly factor BamE (lipoprotein component of BamABCDE complex)